MSNNIHKKKNPSEKDKYQVKIKELLQIAQNSSVEQLPSLYDQIACCYFYLENYSKALDAQDFAISLNSNVKDYYINKADILKKMYREQEAHDVLLLAETIKNNDEVNNNLNDQEKTTEEEKRKYKPIKQRQYINIRQQQQKKLVENLQNNNNKQKNNYIQNKDNQLINIIINYNKQKDNIIKYLQMIQKQIIIRQKNIKKQGNNSKQSNIKFINKIKQLINWKNQIQKNIQYTCQKKIFYQKIQELFIYLTKKYNDSTHIFDQQKYDTMVKNLTRSYHLYSKKQLSLHKNQLTFKQIVNKLPKGQIIYEQLYTIGGHKQKPIISVIITPKVAYIHLQINFFRNLTPTKSLKFLQNLPIETSKTFFHLYWFTLLRILFNCEQGVNITLLLFYKNALLFIYEQMDNCQDYKLSNYELIISSIYIFEKYNKIYENKMIDDKKRTKIYENCEQFKSYLNQIDENYESILKKQRYINLFTKNQNTNSQQFFRQQFNLNDQFNDRIAENLIIIFNQFGQQFKPISNLLIQAFPKIALIQQGQFSYKKKLFHYYYDLHHSKDNQSVARTIWNKFTSLLQF